MVPDDRREPRILVVDDEDAVRLLARTVLERDGFRVECVASAGEAVAAVERDVDRIDAVVLDVMLPDRPGTEVHRRIRELRSELPVVFTSGYTREEAMPGRFEDPRETFLQKPFRATALCAAVRTAVHNGRSR